MFYLMSFIDKSFFLFHIIIVPQPFVGTRVVVSYEYEKEKKIYQIILLFIIEPF